MRGTQLLSVSGEVVGFRGCASKAPALPGLELATMTTWEYLTAPLLIHNTKQILDNFGLDGWELVQIVPGPNAENLVAYFKRPRA